MKTKTIAIVAAAFLGISAIGALVYAGNEENEKNENKQKLTMNYPIVIGNDDIAEKFGGLLGYPTSVLISRDGKQVKRITGIISYEEMTHAIESLL